MIHAFELDGAGSVSLEVRDLIVAGWTGRDPAAVQHHIEELQELGVAPPSKTPLFYRTGAELLTQSDRIQVVGSASSGEAEAVVIAGPDGNYLTLGSDHTDREAEAISVAVSKQLCPKPIASTVWRLSDVAPHWDRLFLRSWVEEKGERVLYQEGALSGMLSAAALIHGFGGLRAASAMFCGTLPAIGGVRPSSRFEMALEDPVLGRTLHHAYTVETLPVVA
ncbi:DUF2848 domain-containing protein [Tropicimonas sp. S265A]|uniref:DUF2848 domain-containing protein n=1 Tax=Tropicimonas sp. S265A TaxID=3415134 RepID=UPI003C7A45D9